MLPSPTMPNIPTRLNNPGDLRYVGQNLGTPNPTGFAQFPDAKSGYAALLNDVQSKINTKPDATLADFANIYAPSSDGNDSAQYAAKLANQLGVSPATPIKQLEPRIGDFAQAIAANEGYAGAQPLTPSKPQPTIAQPSGTPPVAAATPENPAGVSGTASLANVGKNLSALPGELVSAGKSLLPAIPDLYNDATGQNTGTSHKTLLQQAGDVGTTALTAASVIPGVDLADVAGLGGKGLLSAATRGGLLGAGFGASGALGAGDTDPTQIGIKTAEGAAGGAATEGLLSKITPITEANKLKSAIEDATPSYSKSIDLNEGTANGAPRVEEGGGLIKPRKVNSSVAEVAAGTEGAKIPNYPVKGTALEKYNTIQPAIAAKADALMQSLAAENVLRPPQELKALINSAVDKAGADSFLLQNADPAIKNYQRVAARAIKQSPGTLAGEMQVRQALDNAYEDAGGKYGNNKALDQIHRAARNALNDDMEAKATNTAVKQSLREQSNLYNLQDVLGDKAKAEGGSRLAQLAKKNPVTAGLIKTGIGLTGLKDVVLPFIP